MQLTLVIEGSKGSDMVQKIIRWMRVMPLAEIMQQPEIQALYLPLYDGISRRSKSSADRSTHDQGVIFFDLAPTGLEGYNKFIPYYLHPESLYTVSVSTSTFRTKVSVGSNPWASKPLKHNLATICERYGGGGHAKVGAISFEIGELEKARNSGGRDRGGAENVKRRPPVVTACCSLGVAHDKTLRTPRQRLPAAAMRIPFRGIR